ncbi:hypothetical protein SAMN05428946_1796 [Edaphobacillus lindanitolerans]|uniref:Uncharacterized protein n=1 Tax=Edaphobacillus lindanitolerans TaxID=550447 RepID=A0A1U7PQV3_9BACI|nr:hypothetical protein SAMN05428946_1796 [Edaphobacillus lindanitolerans]
MTSSSSAPKKRKSRRPKSDRSLIRPLKKKRRDCPRPGRNLAFLSVGAGLPSLQREVWAFLYLEGVFLYFEGVFLNLDSIFLNIQPFFLNLQAVILNIHPITPSPQRKQKEPTRRNGGVGSIRLFQRPRKADGCRMLNCCPSCSRSPPPRRPPLRRSSPVHGCSSCPAHSPEALPALARLPGPASSGRARSLRAPGF